MGAFHALDLTQEGRLQEQGAFRRCPVAAQLHRAPSGIAQQRPQAQRKNFTELPLHLGRGMLAANQPRQDGEEGSQTLPERGLWQGHDGLQGGHHQRGSQRQLLPVLGQVQVGLAPPIRGGGRAGGLQGSSLMTGCSLANGTKKRAGLAPPHIVHSRAHGLLVLHAQ